MAVGEVAWRMSMTFVVVWMRVTPVECPTQVATPAPSQVRREFAATQEGSDPRATSAQNGAHTPRRFMDLRCKW